MSKDWVVKGVEAEAMSSDLSKLIKEGLEKTKPQQSGIPVKIAGVEKPSATEAEATIVPGLSV